LAYLAFLAFSAFFTLLFFYAEIQSDTPVVFRVDTLIASLPVGWGYGLFASFAG